MPRPEQAGTIYGTAGRLRPVRRGATRAHDEAFSRAIRRGHAGLQELIDWDEVSASLRSSLAASRQDEIAYEVETDESAESQEYGADDVYAFFRDVEAVPPDRRLDLLNYIRETDAYRKAPARQTRLAEQATAPHSPPSPGLRRPSRKSCLRTLRRSGAAQASGRRPTCSRPARWGYEGPDKPRKNEAGEDYLTTLQPMTERQRDVMLGISTSSAVGITEDYTEYDDSLLIEIDADSMRAAHAGAGGAEEDLPAVMTPATALGEGLDDIEYSAPDENHGRAFDGRYSAAMEMACLAESRIRPGTSTRDVRPAAFHVTRGVLSKLKELGVDLDALARLAPIVVHGGNSIPGNLDPTASPPPPPSRSRAKKSGPLKGARAPRAASASHDGSDGQGTGRIVQAFRSRLRRAGIAFKDRAALVPIIRRWRPDIPAGEIIRALGGSPGDLRRAERSGRLRQAIARVLGGSGAAEILPGLWSVATRNGSAIVMASSAQEAIRSEGRPASARVAALRARLRRLVASWDESKHPRGQPGNPGQFAEVEGGDGSDLPGAVRQAIARTAGHRDDKATAELLRNLRTHAEHLWRRSEEIRQDGSRAAIRQERRRLAEFIGEAEKWDAGTSAAFVALYRAAAEALPEPAEPDVQAPTASDFKSDSPLRRAAADGRIAIHVAEGRRPRAARGRRRDPRRMERPARPRAPCGLARPAHRRQARASTPARWA